MMTESAPTDGPGGPGDRVDLSLEQEFIRLQFAEDGSAAGAGHRPVSGGAWRLTGEVDITALRHALTDIVARHEALRTRLVRDSDGWHQEIHPPSPPELVIRDLPDIPPDAREQRAEEFLNEIYAQPYEAGLPALQAYLGRFDERDAVLVLTAFYPLIDLWSVYVVMRDLAECYAARREGRTPKLETARQQRDYVAWQRSRPDEMLTTSYRYWQEKLSGAGPIALPADRPPSGTTPTGTRWQRFSVDAELGGVVTELARAERSSPFMVLFATYLLHLHRRTGAVDGVVWALGPGRRERWVEDVIGFFVNMFPLRVDLRGANSFRDVVRRVRATCLEAYAHEVPFVQLIQGAPEAMGSLEQGGLVVPGFQMSPNLFGTGPRVAGDLTYRTLQRRLSHPVGPDIPDDAILWTVEVDPSGELRGSVLSSIDRFDEETITAMISEYRGLLEQAVRTPDAPIDWTAPASRASSLTPTNGVVP